MTELPPPPPPPSPVAATGARARLAEPTRQSPIAVVFLVLKMIRNIGLINLGIAAAFVFGGGIAPWMLFAALAAVVGLTAIGVLSWLRFTFHVAGDELVVQKGVLQHERLTVPLDRVQSVSLEQGVLHRLVGVVKATVETAGSSQAEFELDAVERDAAVALQELAAERLDTDTLTRRPTADAGDADEVEAEPFVETVLLRHDVGRLLRIALAQSPWAGLALFAPLLAVGDDLFDAVNLDLGVRDRVSDVDVGSELVVLIAVVLAVATLFSVVLQVVREILTHWDLTLTRTASGLRRDAGLFSKTTLSTSLPRVQRFETGQTVLQYVAGIHTVRLPTVGSGDLTLPGVRDDELEQLRTIVLEPDERPATLDRRVSPLAVFLAVRNSTVVAVLVALGAWFAIGWWSLLALLAVPMVGLSTRRSNRLFRWGMAPAGIAKREQFVAVGTSAMSLHKTQSVLVTQRFFERRRDLATVRVRTAEGAFSVGMLDLDEARALRDRLLYVVEQNDAVGL